jgi:phosphatidylinositol-3-phosphatase
VNPRWTFAVGATCLAIASVLIAGCSGGPDPRSNAATTSPLAAAPRLEHVAVLVMENDEYGQVIGTQRAAWLTREARRGGLATNYYSVTHPSLPNYLALLGGSTFGIADDCIRCHVDSTNLVDQLESAGLTWRAYMESVPSPCFKPKSGQDEQGLYAKRHNPFFYFDDVRSDPRRCAEVVPYTQLASDASSSTELPDFLWITPNVCNDTHDCPVARGDHWLSRNVPAILDAMGPESALFITWDEGVSDDGCCGVADGGRVPLVALGPAVRPRSREAAPRTHYSLLRTIEDVFGLPALGHAKSAGDLDALLRGARGTTG